jgi:hypothetical protein
VRTRKAKEKNLETRVRELLKSTGGGSVKMGVVHWIGFPDRLCLIPMGFAFFAEIKSEGKKPTLIQRKVHDWLRSIGFDVLVVDSELSYLKFKQYVEQKRNVTGEGR